MATRLFSRRGLLTLAFGGVGGGAIWCQTSFCDSAANVDIYEKFLKPFSSSASMLNVSYPPEKELQMVQIIFRHGDRTPVRTRLQERFPAVFNVCSLKSKEFVWQSSLEGPALEYSLTYLNSEGSYKPKQCYVGQLTTRGQRHAESAGRLFRQLYVDQLHFIPRRLLENSELYVRSTDFPRTIQTAQSFLTGLYPARYRGDDPIEIHLHQSVNDTLHPQSKKYKQLREMRKAYEETESCVEARRAAEPFLTALREATNEASQSHHGFFDELLCRTSHRLPVPEGVTVETLEALERASLEKWFGFLKNNPTACGMCIGEFVADLWRSVKSCIAGEIKTKMEIYSAHDTSIAPLLHAFGVFDDRWPPYNATIVFEVFAGPAPAKAKQGDDEPKRPYYVRMLYNQVVCKLPGCESEFCEMEKFEELVKKILPPGHADTKELDEEAALR